jgi:two-component system response regulator AtoC
MSDRRVLVVEDDPIIRRFIRDVLKRKGYDIQGSENGLDALDKVKQKDYQLVISDLKMEGMDGLELLSRVKKISPNTEVIIITAYGTVSNAVNAMKMGAFDYIMKPIELEELEIVIERVFEHRSLVDENQYLKERLQTSHISQIIIGKSAYSSRIRELSEMVGPLDSTVLIMGETGSGKEVVANCIHQLSRRKDQPYIKVNCAALPDTLLESELFGHEKGAFTGALERTKGRFELADRGTLLLDEVGELGLQVQAKLLRALQYQQFERVGSGKPIDVDVRVIATTNRNLKEEVKQGRFRKDLFFRLNVVTVTLMALRDRKEDIPFYIEHFLKVYNEKYKKNKVISNSAMDFLIQYDWPGNVRELENCLETAIILHKADELLPEHFVFLEDHRDLLEDERDLSEVTTIAEAEKRLILKTYKRLNSNKTHAAKVLGITIKTLRTKLREYGVIEGG